VIRHPAGIGAARRPGLRFLCDAYVAEEQVVKKRVERAERVIWWVIAAVGAFLTATLCRDACRDLARAYPLCEEAQYAACEAATNSALKGLFLGPVVIPLGVGVVYGVRGRRLRERWLWAVVAPAAGYQAVLRYAPAAGWDGSDQAVFGVFLVLGLAAAGGGLALGEEIGRDARRDW
jgi:hypothetical protein